MKTPQTMRRDELTRLANVGPATRADLERLGIDSIAALSRQEPSDLYHRLARLVGKPLDPCVWDVFAAAIHQARGGEPMPWWRWTPIRKERQRSGSFDLPLDMARVPDTDGEAVPAKPPQPPQPPQRSGSSRVRQKASSSP